MKKTITIREAAYLIKVVTNLPFEDALKVVESFCNLFNETINETEKKARKTHLKNLVKS